MDEVLIIKRLEDNTNPPYELLNLAEPFMKVSMDDYIERGICYMAYNSSKQLVGAYVLLKTQPFIIELVNVSIDKAFRGKGNGRRLVEHAISQAIILGYEILEIGVGNSSIDLLASYQREGFNISSIEFDFFKKHYPETIIENGIECRHLIKLRMQLIEN